MNIGIEFVRTPAREFKDAVYSQLAGLGQALASGSRLELLELLCQGPRTVEALAREVGQSVANTSHHLRVLARARLVTVRREGVHRHYVAAGDAVGRAFVALREVAEARLPELAEITRDFHAARGSWEPVDQGALLKRVREGTVTVLDVRPALEYRAGHLPGALSVPLEELERRLHELPRKREVVAYCRGPYCVLAMEAVTLLRAHGLRAVRLDLGVPDWRARGLPVESVTEVSA